MDIFFKQSTENFFNQFNLASDDKYGADEVINENDERIHDAVEDKVAERVRLIDDLGPDIYNEKIDNIGEIIERLQCPFCLEVAAQPVFIKYCLHFFCKTCIEQQIRNYKKECPLCKISMGTKRELRFNSQIENILRVLRPAIDDYQDSQNANYEEIQKHQIKEQLEMAKLKKSQMLSNQQANHSSNKKRISLEDELLEEEKLENMNITNSIEEILHEKTLEEIEEQRRIQRKVERLKALANQKEVMLSKFMKVNEQSAFQDAYDIRSLMLSTDDAKYYQAYEKLKKKIRENQNLYPEFYSKNLKLYDEPKKLDIKVKLIFDEDLRTLLFPKVKEFTFRAASDAPLEIAAKALALKNDHPHLWTKYSFSVIKKRRIDEETVEQQEVEINDLRKSFGMMKDHLDQKEIIMFYKINAEFQSPFKIYLFDKTNNVQMMDL